MKIQKLLLTKLFFPFASLIFLGTYFLMQPIKAMELTWDDPEKGTGLHVSSIGKDRRGKEWNLREVRTGDTPFYQTLFADVDFVKKVLGLEKPIPAEVVAGWVEGWVKEFANGMPFGRMTIEQGNEIVGSIGLRRTGESGVGEIGHGVKLSAQRHGLGTEAIRFILEKWALKVRQIGCGQDTNAPLAAVYKFSFDGEPLKMLHGAAAISNPFSWQSTKHFGFRPAQVTDNSYEISCEGWEKPADKPLDIQYKSLETYLMAKHFSSTSPHKLQVNVRYRMLDETGTLRTLSFSEKYQELHYHFEYDLPLYKSVSKL